MKERGNEKRKKKEKKKIIITSQFNPDWCLSYFKGHIGSKFMDFKALV